MYRAQIAPTKKLSNKLIILINVFFFFRPHELFNWLLALDDRDYETWDKGRISWHVRYQRAAARTHRPSETSKLENIAKTSKLESVAKTSKVESVGKLTSTLVMMADQGSSSNVDVDKHNDDEEMVRMVLFYIVVSFVKVT